MSLPSHGFPQNSKQFLYIFNFYPPFTFCAKVNRGENEDFFHSLEDLRRFRSLFPVAFTKEQNYMLTKWDFFQEQQNSFKNNNLIQINKSTIYEKPQGTGYREWMEKCIWLQCSKTRGLRYTELIEVQCMFNIWLLRSIWKADSFPFLNSYPTMTYNNFKLKQRNQIYH